MLQQETAFRRICKVQKPPHPQPFSPAKRGGEGSKKVVLVVSMQSILARLNEWIFNGPGKGVYPPRFTHPDCAHPRRVFQ